MQNNFLLERFLCESQRHELVALRIPVISPKTSPKQDIKRMKETLRMLVAALTADEHLSNNRVPTPRPVETKNSKTMEMAFKGF
jgi:hypothetical protein